MSIPELITAARMGNIPEIRRLLAAGVPINGQDEHGRTALMHALSQSKEAAALELLGSPGIDVTVVSPADGKTVLILAIQFSLRNVIRHLTEHFRDRLNCGARDNNGQTALFWAIGISPMWSFPMIKMIVENCGREVFINSSTPIREVRTENNDNLAEMASTFPNNPIDYAKARAIAASRELKQLERAIKDKQSRGEVPTNAELAKYTSQKVIFDKLKAIVAYLVSNAPGGAGANRGGARRRHTRRRLNRHRHSRRHRK